LQTARQPPAAPGLSAGVEAPNSLRIAFSLTPSRCATARLLIPWLFSSSIARRPSPAATPAFLAIERRHPTLHIARMVAPHAHRSAKRHQEHHRIGLGESILRAIVMHRQSAADDHALIRFDRKLQRALITTVFDAAGQGSAKLVGRSTAGKLSPPNASISRLTSQLDQITGLRSAAAGPAGVVMPGPGSLRRCLGEALSDMNY
jgi:hypothetical protein